MANELIETCSHLAELLRGFVELTAELILPQRQDSHKKFLEETTIQDLPEDGNARG